MQRILNSLCWYLFLKGMWAVLYWLCSKKYSMEREGKCNFTDRHYLSQMIRVNIKGKKSWWQNVLLIHYLNGSLILLFFPPKSENQSNHEIISENPQLRNMLQNTWLVLFHTLKAIKSKLNDIVWYTWNLLKW